MGQLEKYGLYVLCLVIFLILGVSIWGTGEAPPAGSRTPPVAMNAATTDMVDEILNAVESAGPRTEPLGGESPIDSLLNPGQPPKPRKTGSDGGKVATPPAVGDKTVGAAPADGGAKRSNGGGADDGSVRKEASATRTYTIKKGDMLGAIAERELGSSRHVAEIERLNPGLDARRLQPGSTIVLPASVGESVPKTSGEALRRAGAFRSYVVVKGDTFEGIAKSQLGSARRVDEIRKLNPGVEPTSIKVGQKIKLPLP